MLGGIIPSSKELAGKSIMAAVTVSEGIVMLTIAVFLDLSGIILFFLSLTGVGIPLSWFVTFGGIITIGTWVATRSMFRGVIQKASQEITKKVLKTGEEEEQKSPTVETGKNAAKTGAKVGISFARLIITFIIKLIPFVNNLFPAWTITVVFELVQGEI